MAGGDLAPAWRKAFKALTPELRLRWVEELAAFLRIMNETELRDAMRFLIGSSGMTSPAEATWSFHVDFEHEMVLLQTFGPQYTGAITGRIAKVEEYPDHLMVLPILSVPWGVVTADIG